MRKNSKPSARRRSATLDTSRRRTATALAPLIGLCIAIGCATPEERYRTLSFLFDDVPMPESMRARSESEAPALAQGIVPALSKEPAVVWVTHDPDCDECHTSKQALFPYAMPPDLCWDCHDAEDFANTIPHGPFAAGACLQCHNPHKSQHASLLIEAPADLCASCHDATTFPALEQHQAMQGEDCIECHDPHAAPARYMLQESAAAPAARASSSRGGSRKGS
jgi:predicted CXXCH cytochrome family protein